MDLWAYTMDLWDYLSALCLFLTMQIFSDPISSDAAIIDMVSNFKVFVTCLTVWSIQYFMSEISHWDANISLMSGLRVLPGKKLSSEWCQIYGAYFQNVVRTNEIAGLLCNCYIAIQQ